MNYQEAMEYISSTTKFGMNLGLKRIERLLYYMGNPERGLKCIHIAGTNGKGSTTAMISSMLIESGFQVGIYTSPYLQRFSERIRINEREISKEDIVRLIEYIKPIVEKVAQEGHDHPTEFEVITALMFKYFQEKKVDLAVLEVGLGGRLDSTNVIDPLLSVITSIDYDHMAVLGNTLGKIAYEKAGIIKEGGIVVTYPQQKEAYEVIREVSREKNALLIDSGIGEIKLKSYSIDSQIFDIEYKDEKYEDLAICLLGEHQLMNARTAVCAVKALREMGISIGRESIYQGLRKAKWPGRLEVMGRNPMILLDGAHNLQGIISLKEALKKYFSFDRLVLVMGVLKDKQVEEMCRTIMPMADRIVAASPDSDRALPAEDLGKIASLYCSSVEASENIDDAFNKGMSMTGTGDLLLFCGSLYMIGHIRTILEEHKNGPII